MSVKKLSEIVQLNSNFRNAINLYLNLNKRDKIESYIPTKSSLQILERYMEAIKENKNQSTILVGSYGKGKSHLLLILLAIASMERTEDNNEIISALLNKIQLVDEETGNMARNIWCNKGRFLPVIVSGNQDDLNQTFMVALSDALKREKISDLMPDTFYSNALSTIERWERDYPDTYLDYSRLLQDKGYTLEKMSAELKVCNRESLVVFKEIYPQLTAGSEFNPLAGGDVLKMYQGVADKLCEEFKFSGIYIVFDEFSKFIEGQDKQAAGNNMKLLQDLCELANDSKHAQIFMTLVAHKSIKEYGYYLSDATINAFTGIEGRIEEVLFNTSSKNNYELIQNAIKTDDERLEEIPVAAMCFSEKNVQKYHSLPAFNTVFTKDDFEKIIVRGCFPLSPISTYALLHISEKVAQNERTLFTFISKDEPYSMAKYVKNHPAADAAEWIITPDIIYDYFKNIFKKEISNEHIHSEWLNAEYAISKEKEFSRIRMLKTLALLCIINKYDELPPTEEVLVLASGLVNAPDILKSLESKKLIYKKGANNCYAFKTRAGIELRSEIKKRKALKENVNISNILSEISDIQYVMPKRYNSEYQMTRYFRYEYMSAIDFMDMDDATVFFDDGKFQDGKVVALFGLEDTDRSKEIKNKVKKFGVENLIVSYSRKKFDLYDVALEYEVIQDIKDDSVFMRENQVLNKELLIMEEERKRELAQYVDDEFGENGNTLTFYYNGKAWQSKNDIPIYRAVDVVCENCFRDTLVINNEMINKQFITTSPIKKARKIIMENLLSKESDEIFQNGTSAEATIYRAVMINSGILDAENHATARKLLDIFERYLNSCIEERKPVSLLLNEYMGKPYGMRKGVFPIIFSYVLSCKNEDLVVYCQDKEVSLDVDNILAMTESPDKYDMYISKDSADKEAYLKQLGEIFDMENELNLHGNRISNILTCMQRWYRALPQNTKNLKKNNVYLQDVAVADMLPKFKNIMQQMDVNAYEALFRSIPHLCSNRNDYTDTINVLVRMKKILDGYMDWLLERVIADTVHIFDRKEKEDLSHTLKTWYERQSELAKNGLHDSTITGFMNCIADINTYDNKEIVKKIIKIVSNVYVDAWNDNSYKEYLDSVEQIKKDIEGIGNQSVEGKCELSFTGMNGETLHKYYEKVDESTGAIFRNILEDTLEDFSDLSVNAKVAILLEAIEKIMRKEE